MSVVVVVTAYPVPKHRAEVVAAFEEAIAQVHGEPGVELYALPLIVSHGWPGLVIEQLKIIEPLTNPTGHGGSASDAFDVVIPSLPGYGFSGKPAATGWGPDRIARAWAVLMQRLGYTRYVAQGGDWGTAISAAMARQAPGGLAGIHVNFAQMVPPGMFGHIRNGDPAPADLSDPEKRAYEQVAFATYHRGYGVIQGTRPQTIGYSLADTPSASRPGSLTTTRAPTGTSPSSSPGTLRRHHARRLARQHLALLAHQHGHVRGAAVLAAGCYWQNFYAADISLPAAVTVFPDEYVQAPRSWTEQAYHNLIYFNEAEKGGHFAAWERPQQFQQSCARHSAHCAEDGVVRAGRSRQPGSARAAGSPHLVSPAGPRCGSGWRVMSGWPGRRCAGRVLGQGEDDALMGVAASSCRVASAACCIGMDCARPGGAGRRPAG